MIEVKSIFENVHFVDYGGRSDSGRYKFIKTLIVQLKSASHKKDNDVL